MDLASSPFTWMLHVAGIQRPQVTLGRGPRSQACKAASEAFKKISEGTWHLVNQLVLVTTS
jgi:hypothetical protein